MIPKNIRQIGEGESSRKVYIEDYVITFLKQVQKKLSGTSRSVSLYGNIFENNGNTYVIVKGAMAAGDTPGDYFQDCMLVGQAVVMRESAGLGKLADSADILSSNNGKQSIYYEIRENDSDDEKTHKNDIFESSNLFFLERGKLEPLRTYYLFYEKNDAMQEYLIEWNTKDSADNKESTRDNAVSTFRKNYYEKQEYFMQKKISAYFYVLSTFMLIVSCVIGVSMINSYEKMKNLEAAMSHLTVVMNEQKLPDTTMELPQASAPLPVENDEETEEETAEEAASDSPKETSQQESEGLQDDGVQEAVAAQDVSGQVYIVQEGDTLANISRKFYNTNQRVDEICVINNIADPNKIVMGEKIILP